jgi:hypothetical protein
MSEWLKEHAWKYILAARADDVSPKKRCPRSAAATEVGRTRQPSCEQVGAQWRFMSGVETGDET